MESDFDACMRIIRRCGWVLEIIANNQEFQLRTKNVTMIFDSITGQMKDMKVDMGVYTK